jgi:glycosyltransferase involved in cell wall biosynthesis
MKVIQIVTQMEAGGAQKVASLLNQGLRESGHDARLYFLYKKRPAYASEAHMECLAECRPAASRWLGVAGNLWKRLRSERPDVVITHTHSANAFAAPIAALAGVPVRIAVHHNPVETYPLVARIADRLAFAAGAYSTMVTVSGGVTRSFEHHGGLYKSRLHRIYNGIAPATEHDSFDVRVRYGIPEQHAVLVNVGRLSRQKNQSLLFRMLQHVQQATLLLVGEGELGEELRATAATLGVSDRVRFTGELASASCAAILRQADLFLLPSRYESFCLAAMEAMHHGLPVIASDLPCLREVIGDDQVFFPCDDEIALTNIVGRLLSSSRQRESMGKAGKARAMRFSAERMVGEYELLMSEAMLYATRHTSAAHDLRRVNALGGVSRIHDQL